MTDHWFVYIAECSDGTLYTGIAKNVEDRMTQHNLGKGARYTRARLPVELRAQQGPMEQGDALRLEIAVKNEPRSRKFDRLKLGWPPPEL